MKPVEIIGEEARINIYPKQEAFITSECDEALYGGAVGGGKSYAVMLGCLKRRLENPGSHGMIFRRTFPELENSIIKETRNIYPLFGAQYNSSKHQWKFPNGSLITFGFCEKDGDVYKYLSVEAHDMWFDEATTFTAFQFQYLTSRCRSSIPGLRPIVRLTSNPGNVGHAWVYDRFIKPSQVSTKWEEARTKKTMTFIPARLQDNPSLMENDPNYLMRLKDLPEKKYLALAEGRWDVFEGTYFENFDPRPGHGVLWNIRKPDTFTMKFLSMDWGYSDPACILWYEVTPMGRIYIYRELYTTRRSPKELAADILALCPEGEEYMHLVASPEIWGKTADMEGGGQPIAESMQEILKNKIIMKKANNARVPGWLKVREFLFKAPGDGLPWLQISPNCTNLILEFPAAVHDDRKVEDIDPNCSDHCLESLRYGLVSIGDIPQNILTPYESNYDRIFQIRRGTTESQVPLPKGRGGY